MGYSEMMQQAARAVAGKLEGKTFPEKMAIYKKKKAELARVISAEESRIAAMILKEAESQGFGQGKGFNFNPENPLRNYLSAGRLTAINRYKERQEMALLEAAVVAENLITGHAESLGKEVVSEFMHERSENIRKATGISRDIDANRITVGRFLAEVENKFRALREGRRRGAGGIKPEPEGQNVRKFPARRR